MSSKDIESKVKELQELRRMKEEIDVEITTLEDLVKEEMTARATEDLIAGCYRIKWTSFQSNRFDTSRFKKDHAELAAAYTKASTSRRFSIN
ncbi:MAG: hypothetical protein GX096_06030 [Clostridiales bacterium]|nr:hypothetical protein [Clostridiales bacterium]